MGLRVKGQASPPPATEEGDEETDEQFEERIYTALMRVARASSSKVRSTLGSCVMLGTRYADAGEQVQETIREFIDEADL